MILVKSICMIKYGIYRYWLTVYASFNMAYVIKYIQDSVLTLFRAGVKIYPLSLFLPSTKKKGLDNWRSLTFLNYKFLTGFTKNFFYAPYGYVVPDPPK